MENYLAENKNRLWYKQPAESWENAMPIGNGRLAGMVYGKVEEELISINEESLWAGKQMDANNPEALTYLGKVRELLFHEKPSEAFELSEEKLMGRPCTIKPYEPVGELKINVKGHESYEDYTRELDLENGIARVKYKVLDTLFEREYFASAIEDVLVIKFSAVGTKKLNLEIDYSREKDANISSLNTNTLSIEGQCDNGEGMSFCSYLSVLSDGIMTNHGSKLSIMHGNTVVLFINASTNFKKEDYKASCYKLVEQAKTMPYEKLRENHIKDYKSFFDRVTLNLKNKEDIGNLPTDKRLEGMKNGVIDNELLKLYFDFGRYLLISSSRPGNLPANLQGKWNDSMNPPWNSDYHLNINLQMNYWPAEVCNLSECHIPLFDYLDSLREPGRKTARVHYGCKGFVAHHISDIWGFTAPGDGAGCGIWPSGIAWLCDHLWEHYLFTQDKEFLDKKAYPIMKEASEFLLDYMVEDSKGRLVCGPSSSPENAYFTKDGEIGKLCMGASMDSQIANELFMHCIEAAKVLGIQDEFIQSVEVALKKLPELSIGKYGQLMEWSEDYEEVELGHRHISHLFALYPGSQINEDIDKEIIEAAKITLERRLANGGGHTGWSAAWIANFWARLKNGEKAFDTLLKLLKDSTAPSLLDLHPPFQIDGNFGGTAAIAEMLLQSHGERIELLPALPKEWENGEVKGLRIRGGGEVCIAWKENMPHEVKVKAIHANTFKLKIPHNLIPKIHGSKEVIEMDEKNTVILKMKKDEEVIIFFYH